MSEVTEIVSWQGKITWPNAATLLTIVALGAAFTLYIFRQRLR